MKRLKLLIFIFCLAISIPLIYLILRTYQSLEQEELAELRYFAETIFNEMEEELGSVVMREEGRAIDEYNYKFTGQAQDPAGSSRSVQPRFPQEPYIFGYLQNNPDGSFQTPLVQTSGNTASDQAELVLRMEKVNDAFNRKKSKLPESIENKTIQVFVKKEKIKNLRFAEKYLRLSRFQKQKIHLKHKKRRVEEISINQILNIAQPDQWKALVRILQAQQSKGDKNILKDLINQKLRELTTNEDYTYARIYKSDAARDVLPDLYHDTGRLQVEVDPMQSILLNDSNAYIFRRILLNNQVYHQGAVVKIHDLLAHLKDTYFASQPMAHFTNLRLEAVDQGREIMSVQTGVCAEKPDFLLKRTFPRPFSFLHAKLICDQIPRSSGRKTLNIMIFVLVAVILLGFFTIYKSTQSVVDLSERRSSFVSSVTHELKTPLSTIRMYIEMLEQGIARDHDREQEYFQILNSESSRLSRLINNVLEFANLEKKQRHLNLQEGAFEEVVREVKDIMNKKLRQEGFTLKVEMDEIRQFKYDREVMIQVLINLIENSIKFGKNSTIREIALRVRPEGKQVKISVSDTGPGIPSHALKKVFDNFYRVDNELSRTTSGTGIGLALVKSFIIAMDGSVKALNNDGPGCTIIILLPS